MVHGYGWLRLEVHRSMKDLELPLIQMMMCILLVLSRVPRPLEAPTSLVVVTVIYLWQKWVVPGYGVGQ